jgi:hypothetical protein
MNFAPDLSTVTHGIQLAVAPVFLLTAVSGIIAAVAGRLGRIIDRARFLENRLESGNVDEARSQRMYGELRQLRFRGWLVNGCIALLTLCAMLIGADHYLAVFGRDQRIAHFENRHDQLFDGRGLLFGRAGLLSGRNPASHQAAEVWRTTCTSQRRKITLFF